MKILEYRERILLYALTANGITYMQRAGKTGKYTKPINISTVAEYLELLLDRGIFVELLSDREVCDMTMAQFSRDDILIYQGREEGKAEDTIELLEEIGELSENLREFIMKETDIEILKRWLKIAARAESIKGFEEAAGIICSDEKKQ